MKNLFVLMERLPILGVLFALTLTTACVLQLDLENVPDVDIPVEDLNSQVSVFAPKGWNTFKVNEPIELEIYVTGSEKVIFPPDFGVKTFLYDNGEWIEVVETVPITYPPGDVILPPSNGNPFMAGGARSFPILLDASDPTLLRIFVFGYIYRDGKATDEKVGAYVDVILHH